MASHWEEVDRLASEGWPGAIEQIRLVSLRLLEIMVNIYSHRKPAMSASELQENGLGSFDLFVEMFDFVNILGGFRPAMPARPTPSPGSFDLSGAAAGATFPSNPLLKKHLESIQRAFLSTVDAVEILAQRPGMPTPSFAQVVNLYVELARLKNIQSALQAAASEILTADVSPNDADLFGVGAQLQQVVNRILSPRCVPNRLKLSIPIDPDLDEILAAYVLANYGLSGGASYDFVADSFDASQTHTRNHATISVGTSPYHAPESLCFDKRAIESPTTNSDLVIQHAVVQGVPMDFAEGISRFAAGDGSEDFQFETDLIGAFFKVCDTPTLAMTATELFLEFRFPTSKAYQNGAWKKSE
jgi:hypothetical protein